MLCLRYVSGLVAVTSMDFGLFIVEPDYEAMVATAKNKNYGEQTRYNGVTWTPRSLICMRPLRYPLKVTVTYRREPNNCDYWVLRLILRYLFIIMHEILSHQH